MSDIRSDLLGRVDDWRSGELARGRGTDLDAVLVSSRGLPHPFGQSTIRDFKRVAFSALDCALAHWYMVPGLQFHRLRVRLEINSLQRRLRWPVSARSLVLDRTIEPASYLGFHFAAKFLARDKLGNYLDVSSPWLFPFTMLSNYPATSATLLTVRAPGLRSLLGTERVGIKGKTRCFDNDVSLDDNSYDTITSLWDPNEELGQFAREVRSLWRVLKPGGTLLLSVPCIKKGGEQPSANCPSPYDADALERHIFEVLGQPKRYAIYGAQTLTRGDKKVPPEGRNAAGGSVGSSVIGRDWRCYSRFQELPGPGVIVMKFSRPEHKSKATSIALTPRLN
jgi:hypothetical protein